MFAKCYPASGQVSISIMLPGNALRVIHSDMPSLAFLSLRGSFLSSLPSTLVNPFHVRYDTLLKRWEQHHKIMQLEISVLSGLELLENRNRIDLILKKFNEVGMFEDKNTKSEWRNMGMSDTILLSPSLTSSR